MIYQAEILAGKPGAMESAGKVLVFASDEAEATAKAHHYWDDYVGMLSITDEDYVIHITELECETIIP